MREDVGSPFFQKGNWNRVDHMGNQILYRILAEDEKYIYVMKLGSLEADGPKIMRPPRNKSYREKWLRSTAQKLIVERRLTHMGERALTPEMTQGVIRPADKERLKHRKLVVYGIVRRWRKRLFTDHSAYVEAVNLASLMHGTDVATITKWVEQYFFFGKHKFALIAQHSNKGKTGPRRGAKGEDGKLRKQGRPVVGQAKGKPDLRKMITPRIARELTRYIEAAAKDDVLFDTAIDGFIETRYAYYRDKTTGETVCTNVSVEKLGGTDNLKRLAAPIYKNARAQKEAMKKFESKRRARFVRDGIRIMVHDQLPILDIDGTTVDNQVMYRGREVYIPGHGKPTLMLGADRGSNAIVGYHVTFTPENSACYRELMKSVYSSKERDLLFHGVGILDGFVHGYTSKIFIDRGPGIANAFQDAIETLRVSSLFAAPGDPQGKGLIEGIMKHIQKALSELPGSTYKSGDEERDYKRKQASETEAVSYDDFMEALLIAISRWNMEVDNRILLTEDMKDKGILPSPKEVYLYYKARLRGDAAFVWPQEDVFRRLYHNEPRTVDDDGIVEYEKGKFTSPDLLAYASHYKRIHGTTMEITVYDLGHNGMHLLWDMPDGNLGLLEANGDTALVRAPSARLKAVSNHIGNALYREATKRSRRNLDNINRHIRNRNAMSKKHVNKMAAADKIAIAQSNAQLTSPAEAKRAATKQLNDAKLAHSLGGINVPMKVPTPAVVPPKDTLTFQKSDVLIVADDD
ncbi:hypothetical protein [uncultured Herbaspirillum sp.]|uniref:hypothetical protein n=1 Tax=uncultured Herbaspirillum sp. TaxID=160236 RepID=UPI002590A20A|nr:hypothetical protein [uncultured Herbaspirillum sp.]